MPIQLLSLSPVVVVAVRKASTVVLGSALVLFALFIQFGIL